MTEHRTNKEIVCMKYLKSRERIQLQLGLNRREEIIPRVARSGFRPNGYVADLR
jgi:hypothetical protein